MNENTLKKLHNVMLEILDDFVNICEENNLTYFLIAGTLLGAVRHKGFIPWDDDIDIAMSRKDYNKLLDIFTKDNNSKYYILSNRSPITTFYHFLPYAKLCKKGTVFAESCRVNPDDYSGIFIDIWPYDNTISFFLPLQAFFIKAARKIYRLKTRFDFPKNKISHFLNKIFCVFIFKKPAFFLQNISYIIFNKFNTKSISLLCGTYDYKTETHRRDMIFPLSKLNFEGRLLNVPNNWEHYLGKYYKNFMELPPVEQRKTHEPHFIIFGDEENK